MRDNEMRGIILEALYNHRRRDLVDFETELGKLPLCAAPCSGGLNVALHRRVWVRPGPIRP
jgi:hypothetical protein